VGPDIKKNIPERVCSRMEGDIPQRIPGCRGGYSGKGMLNIGNDLPEGVCPNYSDGGQPEGTWLDGNSDNLS